jgi:hypothetical protein
MASKEIKVGELLANSVEDHFFNPATLGYYLSQQPNWTIDRVMEVVFWIIEKNARIYEAKAGHQEISEGLALAYKLDQIIDRIKEANQFNHIRLP